jgi:uncharacterized protein (DUF1697 family)
MPAHVALLRGINVGKAKRVAMADLRPMLSDLGFRAVRTLLNSGNAVFDAPAAPASEHAARIEAALASTLGVSARVVVLPGSVLHAVVSENPLRTAADANPAAFLVGFVPDVAALAALAPLAAADWSPEALAVGRHAAYIDCAGAILKSRVLAAIGPALGDRVTTRNWATVRKIHDLLASPSP